MHICIHAYTYVFVGGEGGRETSISRGSDIAAGSKLMPLNKYMENIQHGGRIKLPWLLLRHVYSRRDTDASACDCQGSIEGHS